MLREAVSEAFQTGLVASWCRERLPSPARMPISALVMLLARLQLMDAVVAEMSRAAEYRSAISLPCHVAFDHFRDSRVAAAHYQLGPVPQKVSQWALVT